MEHVLVLPFDKQMFLLYSVSEILTLPVLYVEPCSFIVSSNGLFISTSLINIDGKTFTIVMNSF